MTPTKFQLKKLERALERAAKLSQLHAEALDVASLKIPDFSGPCPRKIKNEFGQLFHID